MSARSPARLDARGVPIVFPTQSPHQSPRTRRQHTPLSRSAADNDMDEVKLYHARPKISTPVKQDRSLLNEHDKFTDACHRSHLNHISRMFYQGASSPNSWQDVSTEPIPNSAKASPTSPAIQGRQRRSPYGSPFQRLDTARQTRNQHPWLSPTRTSTGNKRTIDSPNPFNVSELANKPDQSPISKDTKTTKKRRTLDFLALETNTMEMSWPGPLSEIQYATTPPTQQSSQYQQTKQTKVHLPTPLSQPATHSIDTAQRHKHNHQHQEPSPFLETKCKPSQSSPLSPTSELNVDDVKADIQPINSGNNKMDDPITLEETAKMEPKFSPIEDSDKLTLQVECVPQNQEHNSLPVYDHKQQTPQQSGIEQQQPEPQPPPSKTQDEYELQQQQQSDNEQQKQLPDPNPSLVCATHNQPLTSIQNQGNEKSQQMMVESDSKKVPTNSTTVNTDKAKSDQQLARKQKLQQEMDTLTNSVKLLSTHYQLLDKIGCGTFSSVYKALDIRHDVYDNSFWEPAPPIPPNVAENDTTGDDTDIRKPAKERFVALKQIYATSSPKRMAQEIKILQHLRGAPCVSQLITAFRQHEYVFLVMPYFRHDEFKDCYRSMTMLDTKYYLKSLLTALKHLHSHRILHRDIKPNNFLYNIEMKTGMLIDFGLAQREEETKPPEPPKSNSPIRLNMIRKPARSTSSSTFKQKQIPSLPTTLATSNSQPLPTPTPVSPISATKSLKPSTGKPMNNPEDDKLRKPGYIKHDPRKAIRANRAGTRGFRAPEVLLRVTHQTVAIDIWSVGVILLSLLSGRYPFFIAHDEGDSLIEIASIFGMREMKDCAALHNRTFETNIETIPPARKSLWKLCQVLNTEKFKLWAEDDKQNVQNAIDLVGKMLALDYRKRITAEDALKHPFLSDSQIHPSPSLSSSPSSSSSSSSSYSSSSSL
ncbi:unnamed protein product [Absidia cylindrospora]